jgi:hypothetical protein
LFLKRYFANFDKKVPSSKKSRASFRLSVDEFNMQALFATLFVALESKFFRDIVMADDVKATLRSEKLRMFNEGCALDTVWPAAL